VNPDGKKEKKGGHCSNELFPIVAAQKMKKVW
jgi:hypothetical protein